jgi:DUF4097 and DUF4098 domain-containing protein YvlB
VRFKGKISTVLYIDSRGVLVEEKDRRKAGVRAEVLVTPERLALLDPAYDYQYVETASGDVVVGNVRGDASIRSASGDVRLTDVGGRLDAAAASGDIRGEVVGSVEVKSASGDVRLREVRRDALVRTASGDVTVGRFSGDSFDVKSISGDITVGVPPGRRYDVEFSTLSGEIRTDFPIQGAEEAGSPARLEVKTVSGDIRVKGV